MESAGRPPDGSRRIRRRARDQGTLFPEPIDSLWLKGMGFEKKLKVGEIFEGLQNTRALAFLESGMLIRRCVIASNMKYAPKRSVNGGK